MKKIIASLFFIPVLLTPVAALSEDIQTTKGIGVEGYVDRYREPNFGVSERGEHGSLTGYYSAEQNSLFGSVDGRVSYGTSDYKSGSGTSSGTPEWEFEGRGRIGFSFPLWGGSMSPYTGIGAKYFMQDGKGYYSSLGYFAYDRRIFQAYLPFGVSYAYTTSGGWTITPTAEVDWVVYGNVNSRLNNGGFTDGNLNNTQKDGLGARGELMFGKAQKTFSWQVGPFIRYWKMPDSDVTCTSTLCGLEPKNDRVQGGVALRVLW